MSTNQNTQATSVEIEVTTCQACQEAADLEPWPCCGESTACAECVEYHQTCQDCQHWEDRGMSITTW